MVEPTVIVIFEGRLLMNVTELITHVIVTVKVLET